MLAILLALVSSADSAPAVHGIELPVADVGAAARAYADALGFALVTPGGETARLERDGLVLVLVRSDAPRAAQGAACVRLALGVEDLAAALEAALAAGFDAPELEPRAGVDGAELVVVDPDGHATVLVAAPGAAGVRAVELVLEPDADVGPLASLVASARSPTGAGIAVRRVAAAPRSGRTRAAALLLGVDGLAPATAALAPALLADPAAPPRPSPEGRRVALTGPSGLRVELVERSPAQLAFERLASLAGSWEGRSSAGWTARCEIEVIARGTVVVERTNFEAHPGETMLTLFHRDGEALVLTHYCVAGNQPRLEATAIDGGSVHFTFRDATNLAARSDGHMDQAVFELGGGRDAFSSRWTFAQGGRSSWMEAIEYRRLAADAPPAPAGAGSAAGCGH